MSERPASVIRWLGLVRVLIDALASDGGGSATYWRGFLPALGTVDPGSEYLILRAPWQTFWDFSAPPNVRFVNVARLARRSAWRRALWEQVAVPALVRHHQIDVLFSPADITSLRAPCARVLAIRNFNPYLGGSLGRGLAYYVNRKVGLRRLTWLSARRASRIIFVSEFSRTVVCRQLGIPLDRTIVVHHGLNPIFWKRSVDLPERLRQLPRPYLLTVSDIAAHKNCPFLVRVFARLAERPGFRHHLVIAGEPRFAPDVREVARIADDSGLGGRVCVLGQVRFDDLPALYQGADVFVFPSILETFGHPLVEAMASGLPVVASNATAVPEICQSAAVYFDPTNVAEAAEAIARILADEGLRQELTARGTERAAAFTWERAARETVQVLRAAAA